MRIAAFTKYGPMAASTRHRLLQYLPHLADAGIEVTHLPLLPDAYVRAVSTGSGYSRARTAGHYLQRLRQVLSGTDADVIWIYGELFPFLPSAWEELVFRHRKPVIYDCDDAFFYAYSAHRNPLVRRLLGRKLDRLMRGAAAASCGNGHLQDYVSRFSRKTILLPTVVDTQVYRPRVDGNAGQPVTIGWIGSSSTWGYMQPLLPLLRELAATRGIRVRVVGAGHAAQGESFPGLDLVEWNERREVEEVQRMDIGISLVPDDPWVQGKCGLKLVQYMACGLPAVASPVGVNRQLITPGVNGLLPDGEQEWRSALLSLIDDATLRRSLGAAGRQRACELYSLDVQAPRLIELLKTAV
jgi:hypothetical protein